jgi:2-polyprenyl-3-methyl-5-hydroxy-6-metoxy-1,4-benzoquinol methylase
VAPLTRNGVNLSGEHENLNDVATDAWNHNIHYHSLILRQLPPDCRSVLDVGCGEGLLARKLSRVVPDVMAIDLDAPTIALARQQTDAGHVEYVVGDFLTYSFEPASFDAILSVAALHHMGTAVALRRMQELLRPGGTLAVVGLARSRYPADLAWDLAGAIGTRLHKLTKTYWETSAPKIWPPPDTFGQTRGVVRTTLAGARYRRHILWRYSLVWTKPAGDSL